MPYKINNHISVENYIFNFELFKNQILQSSNPVIHPVINKAIDILLLAETVDKHIFKQLKSYNYYFDNEAFFLTGNIYHSDYFLHFDVHYILKNISNLEHHEYSVTKNDLKHMYHSEIKYDKFFRYKEDNILLLASTFIKDYPIIVLDGNHRISQLINDIQDNLMANLIPYQSINSDFFMFKFDYVFFKLICELYSPNFTPNSFLNTLTHIEKELLNILN